MTEKHTKPLLITSYLLDCTLGLDFWISYSVTEDITILVHDDGTKTHVKGNHIDHILDMVGNKNGRYKECLAYFQKQEPAYIDPKPKKGIKNGKS